MAGLCFLCLQHGVAGNETQKRLSGTQDQSIWTAPWRFPIFLLIHPVLGDTREDETRISFKGHCFLICCFNCGRALVFFFLLVGDDRRGGMALSFHRTFVQRYHFLFPYRVLLDRSLRGKRALRKVFEYLGFKSGGRGGDPGLGMIFLGLLTRKMEQILTD